MKDRKRAVLFSLYLFPFIMNIALIDFIIPIKYDSVLDNLPLLGFLITLAWIASSFLDFAVGDLTDKIGVRKTLQLGVALSFLGSVIFALSSNFVIMTLGVFVWGLSYVLLSTPSNTLIFSSFPKKYVGSAYGWLYSFWDIAYAFAPLLALLVVTFLSIDAVIVIAAFIPLLTLIMAFKISNKAKEGVVDGIGEVLYRDGIIRKELKDIKKMSAKELSLFLNMFVCGFWFVTILMAAPLLFFHGGGNLFQGAMLAFAFMLPMAIIELVYGRLANTHKRRTSMIKYGFLASALLLFVFYFTQDFAVMLVIAFLTTLTMNMAWVGGEVSVSEYLPKGRKGEFTGIFVAGKDLGFDLAPLFYGLFASISLKIPFLVLGIVLLTACILFFIVHRK
jgi:MFS family permease